MPDSVDSTALSQVSPGSQHSTVLRIRSLNAIWMYGWLGFTAFKDPIQPVQETGPTVNPKQTSMLNN